MTKAGLAKVVQATRCRVVGWEEAGNDGQRLALAALVRAFDNTESAVLCEPSLARKTARPPDLVLIDPEVGVHVLEVKGVSLDQVEGLDAGGQVRMRYATGVRTRSPIAQVRNAMFDIKDATVRAFEGEARLPFRYWVVFPLERVALQCSVLFVSATRRASPPAKRGRYTVLRTALIRRAAWTARFGDEAFCPPEFLFADDLNATHLAHRSGASDRVGSRSACGR